MSLHRLLSSSADLSISVDLCGFEHGQRGWLDEHELRECIDSRQPDASIGIPRQTNKCRNARLLRLGSRQDAVQASPSVATRQRS